MATTHANKKEKGGPTGAPVPYGKHSLIPNTIRILFFDGDFDDRGDVAEYF